MEFNANKAAFFTSVSLACVTVGAGIAAATAVSTVSMVALGVLTTVAAGSAIASVTAWLETKDRSAAEYFTTFKDHAVVGTAAMFQMAAQAVFQGLISGLASGIGRKVSDRIAGPQKIAVHRY